MRWVVEFSEEVRAWYAGLSPAGKAATDRIIERLASQGNMLRMPHSRSLDGGLYELRFSCENVNERITYMFDPDRKAVTLTTFHSSVRMSAPRSYGPDDAQAAREAARQTAGDTERR